MTTAFAKVFTGQVRQTVIKDKVFPVVKQFNTGQKGPFITVDASAVLGSGFGNARVYADPADVQFVTEDDYRATLVNTDPTPIASTPEKSDDERIAEIGERFEMMTIMTKAMMVGSIRGMIISGPPGVGKSYGVEQEIRKMDMFTDLGGGRRKAEMVKGAMSPRGLYEKLYDFSGKGDVLVFDDCDDVLKDSQSLNLLKASLDSSATRYLTWASDRMKDGPPNRFEFKGSVMFITNMDFEKVTGKTLKPHIDALLSRCHYLDLTLHTMRDRILRVKQIAASGELFAKHEREFDMSKEMQEKVLDFMYENSGELREVSLRMALKIADCWVIHADKWEQYARNTCMRGRV